MQLLQPAAHFAIKSSLASNTDKKFSQAIFINVCSHAAAEAPTMRSAPGGNHWMLPYLVGKMRYDQDGDSVVNTVDVVYNPQSIEKSKEHREYHRIVASANCSCARLRSTLLSRRCWSGKRR